MSDLQLSSMGYLAGAYVKGINIDLHVGCIQ